MAFHNVEKWTIGYALIKAFFKLSHNCFFYRKIETQNIANVPDNAPVIFAPNHQNALMDPLAVIAVVKGQNVFLARSDIFKNPRIASILYFIKVMPVFRMRDGISNLQKNDEVFDRMVDILKKSKHICILPEGNHAKYRRLRPLAKGLFRIAFKAEEDMDFKLNLHIVPVGIDYSDYYKAYSKVFLNFGKPIRVADYKSIFDENPQKAINVLKSDLAARMSELMIDIRTEEYYETYMAVKDISAVDVNTSKRKKSISLAEKFEADKKLINQLDKLIEENPAKMDGLRERVLQYTEGLQKLKLRDWLLNKRKFSVVPLILESLFFLILSPLFIYGFIHHYLLYKIPMWIIKGPKDPQFTTSLRFSVFSILFPFYYLIVFLAVLPFLPFLWLKLAYAITLPLFGLFTIRYYIRLKKLIGKWRITIMRYRKDENLTELQLLREEIIRTIQSLDK